MWHLRKKKKAEGELERSKKIRWGGAVKRQKCAGAGTGEGRGGGIQPVREWGGWLNDSTSPFQLQQLPIYIVMQIHGPSQMVLFQHRGCTEIWLFIHSTSEVFNAPSSVCFHPFLSSLGGGLKQPDAALPNGNREAEDDKFGRRDWQARNWEITETNLSAEVTEKCVCVYVCVCR